MTPSDAEITRFDTRLEGGPTLRGESDGTGVPVVLLHGLTATRRYVLQGSRLLARSGYRLVGYDARGHGDSDPAPEPSAYAYPDLVGDLAHVLDELGLGRPVLAGSSMGAATAMAYALAQPDRVSALVQITPSHEGRPSSDPNWERLAEALDRDDVEGFVEASGAPSLPARFRDVASTATRQRIERHRSLRAVADALRAVPRSVAFDGLDALETLPGLNRSSQQCVREMNVRAAGDGCTGVRRGDSVGVGRLSSRRLARRAGRSGDSRVRAGRGPSWVRPASPPSAAVTRIALSESRIVSCRRLRPPLPGAR